MVTARWLVRLGAVVLLATAMRRHADLGDVLTEAAFWALISIGIVLLAAIAPRPEAALALPRWTGWAAAAGAVLLFAVPVEAAVACAVAAALMLAARLMSGGRLAHGLPWALLSLLVVVGTSAVFDAVALMRVTFPVVTDAAAWLLRSLGVAAASELDHLVVAGSKLDQAFRATVNTTGVAVHASIALLWLLDGWLVAGRVSRQWWRPLLYLPLAVVLRFVLVVGIGITLDHGTLHDAANFDLSPYLDWRCGLVLDLAAAVIVGFFLLRRAPSANAHAVAKRAPAASPPRTALLCAGAVLLGSTWVGDRVLDCTGAAKAGRIAIEERHSQWESSDVVLTRDHYGQESGYNMRGLVDWLEGGFGRIRRLYDPVSAESLRDVDVLVVKTPTDHFTADERQALHQFVVAGGGLILIGDHTNVFGTSEVLNEIAIPYGFRFVYDCCFDQRSRFEFCYRKETPFRNHPILRGLDTMAFEVGCTIDIDSPRVRPVLVGRSLKSQLIDYSVENFYGVPRDTSEQFCGQFPLLVTRTVGAGRVVAIADSTLFSTFSVFMPGRREVVEGMLAFANHRDVGESLRELVYRLSIGVALLLLLFGLRGAGVAAAVACALLAWGTGSMVIATSEAWLYPGNPDHRQPNATTEVKFVWEDTLDWPVYAFAKGLESCYDLFFQYVTRVQAFPRLVRDLGEATAGPGPVIWIDPAPADVVGAAATLARFAEHGGTIMLMESKANALLSAVAAGVGVGIAASPTAATALSSPYGDIRVPASAATMRTLSEHAGAFLRTGDGAPVGLVHAHGQGNVVLLTCGALFANLHYGIRYASIPDVDLRRLYEVQYSLLAAAVGRSSERKKLR